MFKGIFRKLDSILYIQVRPDRLTVRFLRQGKESIEVSEMPLVAIVEHPKLGKQVVAVGNAVKTTLLDLAPNEKMSVGNGFEHPRSIIGDFELSEIAVKHFIRQVLRGRLLVAPVAFVQVLGDWAGGLTNIETRALRELGIMAGAREVSLIEQPDRLMDEQIWELYDRLY
jgi:rod shape-determining protein MreB and related proteins